MKKEKKDAIPLPTVEALRRMRPLVHLIPHTHWDREWYLPLGGFRARAIAMLDGLRPQYEKNPRLAAFLLDGQTVLVEDYLSVRPERTERLLALLRSGRIQTGPWYVLADEQCPSGESLLRNLALGRRDLQRWGLPADGVGALYGPDAFGHPGCLPTLGREFGLGAAVVWRGIDPELTGGQDLVWWEAPDGNRVLAYHLPPDGYEIGANLLVPESALADAWVGVARQLFLRAATRHAAVFVGADHHAPAPDLGELASRLTRVDGDRDFQWSSLRAFLAAAAAEAEDLPVIRGELRAVSRHTWALQGIVATRAPLKRRNSRAELLLTRYAEPLAALAGDQAGTRAAVIRYAWRELVQCHFHDTLGGCAADEVARAATVRMTDVEATARECARTALAALSGHDPDRAREGHGSGPRLVLWNPAARARGGVVTADLSFFRRDVLVGPPGDRSARTGGGAVPVVLVLADTAGGDIEIALQVLSRGVALERVDAARHYPDLDEVERVRVAFPLPVSIPGLDVLTLGIRSQEAAPAGDFAAADGRLLRNGRVEAGVDTDGTVVMRPAGGAGRPFAGLLALESERDRGDTYTFCPVRGDSARRPARAGRVRIHARGPYLAGLEWPMALRCGRGASGGPGRVSAQFQLEAVGDSPVVRCRILLDNQARDHRLRLRFPTGLRGVPALAGAQFGSVARPPAPRRAPPGSREAPCATAPAHRWVAVARRDRGLAVFVPGLFEYEWTRGGDLLVTLLRSVGELSRADLPTRPGHAGWPTPTPEAQCLGTERIRLGLALVTSAEIDRPDILEQRWEDVFVPVAPTWIRDFAPTEAEPGGGGGIVLEGPGLVFSSCTIAENGDGLVLRCFNAGETSSDGRWVFRRRLARAVTIRADGTPLSDAPLASNRTAVPIMAGPRALHTVSIHFAD